LNAQNAATTFTYDANGNQDTVTDALTRVTDSNVDPLNRLIQSTDALMGNTKYRYLCPRQPQFCIADSFS